MRASHTLAIVAGYAERRLEYLHGLVDALPATPDRTHDRIVSFAVIEALNTWSDFARSFYLSCVYRAKRVSGARVSLGKSAHIVNRVQAIDFAVRTIRGASYMKHHNPPWRWSDEPKWHDPSVITRLSPQLALSNVGQIQTAFGIKTAVFGELPVFRNFYAHRSEDTFRKVSALIVSNYNAYGFTKRTKPTVFLCSRLGTRPQNTLADYIDDLRNVVGLMPL